MSDSTGSEIADAKRVRAELRQELARSDLTPEQRAQLQSHAAALSGALLSKWLPDGWVRRLIMLAIAALGAQQALTGNYAGLLVWLLLPFLSPRAVGAVAYILGRMSSGRR